MIRATLGVVALGLSLGACASDDHYAYDRPGYNPAPAYAYQGEARASDRGRVVAIDVIPGEGTDTHHSTGVGTYICFSFISGKNGEESVGTTMMYRMIHMPTFTSTEAVTIPLSVRVQGSASMMHGTTMPTLTMVQNCGA